MSLAGQCSLGSIANSIAFALLGGDILSTKGENSPESARNL